MKTDRFYLEAAMKEAEYAYSNSTYPVGAVIVSPDDHIIGRGHNHVYSEGDFTAHAEIEAIREAGCRLMQKGNFESCTLYTTMEPCMMCCGAILLARIKRVMWVLDDDVHGGLRYLHNNKRILNSLYAQKLVDLKISPANEHDLIVDMEAWMKDWNEEKETVLSHWRQKYQSMRLTPGQYPKMDRENEKNLTPHSTSPNADNPNGTISKTCQMVLH